MPHVPSIAIGNREKPTAKPHLGLATNHGSFYPIVPGNVLAFIEDPANAASVVPVILISVDHKKIEFRCACGQQQCTRSATFKASWRGRHPRIER